MNPGWWHRRIVKAVGQSTDWLANVVQARLHGRISSREDRDRSKLNVAVVNGSPDWIVTVNQARLTREVRVSKLRVFLWCRVRGFGGFCGAPVQCADTDTTVKRRHAGTKAQEAQGTGRSLAKITRLAPALLNYYPLTLVRENAPAHCTLKIGVDTADIPLP
jgi:hypothetical protein